MGCGGVILLLRYLLAAATASRLGALGLGTLRLGALRLGALGLGTLGALRAATTLCSKNRADCLAELAENTGVCGGICICRRGNHPICRGGSTR